MKTMMPVIFAGLAGVLSAGGVLITTGIWMGTLETDLRYTSDAVIQVAGEQDNLEDRVNNNSGHAAVIDTKLDHIEGKIEDIKVQQIEAERERKEDTKTLLDAIKELEQ